MSATPQSKELKSSVCSNGENLNENKSMIKPYLLLARTLVMSALISAFLSGEILLPLLASNFSENAFHAESDNLGVVLIGVAIPQIY